MQLREIEQVSADEKYQSCGWGPLAARQEGPEHDLPHNARICAEAVQNLWMFGARVTFEGDEDRPDLLEIFVGKGPITRVEMARTQVLPP